MIVLGSTDVKTEECLANNELLLLLHTSHKY